MTEADAWTEVARRFAEEPEGVARPAGVCNAVCAHLDLVTEVGT